VIRNHPGIKEPVQPRTYVGQWLLALILNRQAEQKRLSRVLNNGNKGWNSDESVVVGFAFQLAVRKIFSPSVDVREITKFVIDLRSRVRSAAPPDQLVAEALIRDALGDPDVDISDINSGEILMTHGAILLYAARKLELDEPDIKQLILDGERIAFEQGWNPPLAG
jgi:hypothetical protein